MKVYILKDSDFEKLRLKIDRNPAHGRDGGSSQIVDQKVYDEAHRFYNYHIINWINEVKESG